MSDTKQTLLDIIGILQSLANGEMIHVSYYDGTYHIGTDGNQPLSSRKILDTLDDLNDNGLIHSVYLPPETWMQLDIEYQYHLSYTITRDIDRELHSAKENVSYYKHKLKEEQTRLRRLEQEFSIMEQDT